MSQRAQWLLFLGGGILLAGFVAACGGSTGVTGQQPPAGDGGQREASAGDGGMAPSGDVKVTDGTRLKAVYYQVDGAPPWFAYWYDTVLGADCRFESSPAASTPTPSNLACLPGAFAGPVGFGFIAPSVYADSACSERVVETACGTLNVVAETSGGQLYRVGAALDPSQLFLSGAQGCEPAIPTDPSFPFSVPTMPHRLGAAIATNELVTGSYHHDEGPARVVPMTIVGSDGSVQPVGPDFPTSAFDFAWDTSRSEIVADGLYDLAARHTGRWYPSEALSLGQVDVQAYFSDAQCTMLAAVTPTTATPPREAYCFGAGAGCSASSPTFFEIGAPLDGASIHLGFSGSCFSFPMPNAYALGPPLAATTFAEATEIRVGSGPVKLVEWGTVDGPVIYADGFYDTTHQSRCSTDSFFRTHAYPTPQHLAADGVARCIPERSGGLAFADAACTVLLALSPGGSHEKPSFAVVEEQPTATSCSGAYRYHLYPVLDHYTGTTYGKGTDGSCSIYPSDPATVFATGPELPPDQLAAITVVHP